MLQSINLKCLELDAMKTMLFREYVEYNINNEKPLSFQGFSKICGLSRKQWDLFRFENRENKNLKWLFD